MASHPTIILIPGAYHAPSVFDLIKKKLEALSYPVTAIKLPSVNATSLTVGHKEDAEAVHEVILPLLDAGKEVTLVGHSYGGLPTYISTQGHSIAERSQAGKMGGVRSIVLVAAFAPLVAGQHLSEQNTGSDVSWVTFRAEVSLKTTLCRPHTKSPL
jgi:pimeloyl-ACP methyl ester carboxylesterase